MKIIEGFSEAKAALSKQDMAASFESDLERAVRQILDEVRTGGDAALRKYTSKFDGIELASLEVTREQIDSAYKEVGKELVSALKLAAERISDFHRKQKDNIGMTSRENISTQSIESAYAAAKEMYAALGVDTDDALARLKKVAVSMHCWQGDDVGGFESAGEELGAGLAVTGNYPGKARTPDELRGDAAKALSLIPGTHRFNLHAFYLETGGAKVDRNEIEPAHFQGWIDGAFRSRYGRRQSRILAQGEALVPQLRRKGLLLRRDRHEHRNLCLVQLHDASEPSTAVAGNPLVQAGI